MIAAGAGLDHNNHRLFAIHRHFIAYRENYCKYRKVSAKMLALGLTMFVKSPNVGRLSVLANFRGL